MLDLALEKLSYFPVASVRHDCPSCCVDVPFTELLSFKMLRSHIRGSSLRIAFGRLNPMVLEQLARLFGFPMTVINEHTEDSNDDWNDATRRSF